MAQGKFDIYVYVDWIGLDGPMEIGILSAHFAKAKKVFSFEYIKEWLEKGLYPLLDPDFAFYSGPQFPADKENFGIFVAFPKNRTV